MLCQQQRDGVFFLDWVLGVLVGWIWFIETMKWKSRCGIAKDWGEVKMKIEIWQKWCLMSGVHIHLACLSGFAGLWFWLGADGYWFLQRKERSNAVITDVSEWVSALAPEAPNYPQPGELLETSAERRKPEDSWKSSDHSARLALLYFILSHLGKGQAEHTLCL